MNYNIKGTGVDVSDEIRSYVEKQLGHADKFLQGDSTAHVDVELQHQTTEDRQRYRAEMTLSSGGEVYRAEAFGDTLHEAVDLTSSELVRELRQSKKKSLSRVRRGAVQFKEYVRGFRKRI